MKVLDRKLLRDLRRIRGQAVAIGLIITCGVASWVTVLTAYMGLTRTRDAYYEEYRLADLFAPVKRAPRAALRRLETIDGVRRVQARIVFEVSIDMPGLTEPCFGRTLSLPDVRDGVINDIHLTRGRWFAGDGNREVIVGDRFAEVHGLVPGDKIDVIMNNKKEALTIVGTALSPEFVYMIRGAEIIPDAAYFTVLWLSTSFAESVFDMKDSANEFVATLDREANLDRVIDDFDRELDRYGALGAYGLKDQVSNRFLSDEIEGLKGTATMVPTVFLGVAAFVIHMLLGRLVRTQRTQIAVFRAFGYSTGAIAGHYVKLSLLIGSAGGLLGTALGSWLSRSLAGAYQEFYQFPILRFRLEPVVILAGLGVCLLFSFFGANSAARRAARLRPAEGLVPEPPGVFRRTLVERIGWLWRQLGFTARMVFRNVARAKLRSLFTVSGVALSTSIIFLALYSSDALDEIISFDATRVNRQDILVTFNSERSSGALYEMGRLPGVRVAEPELVVPVRLENGHRHRRMAIYGLDRRGDLRTLIDQERGEVRRPREGLLLTTKLAELLDVRRGEELTVKVLVGRKQVFAAPVEGTVEEYLGAAAYADRNVLARWVDEEDALNTVRLLVDEDKMADLTTRLKNIPAVEGVAVKSRTVANFRDTLAASMGIMTTVLSLFAAVITFGVIYNASRISLAERERTLASMRVLGFRRREVSAVILNENLLLALAAIPPGLSLGVLLSFAMARMYDTDLYRFPLVITGKSLLLTTVTVVLFTLLTNLAIRRRIGRIDLVEALKSRE